MEEWKVALGGTREEGLRQVGVGGATTMVLMLRCFDTAQRIRVGIGGHVGCLARRVCMAVFVAMTMIQDRVSIVVLGNDMGGVLKHRRMVHGEMHLRANAQPKRKEVAYKEATQFHFRSIYRVSVPWQETS
jgi:hypothetical protein